MQDGIALGEERPRGTASYARTVQKRTDRRRHGVDTGDAIAVPEDATREQPVWWTPRTCSYGVKFEILSKPRSGFVVPTVTMLECWGALLAGGTWLD